MKWEIGTKVENFKTGESGIVARSKTGWADKSTYYDISIPGSKTLSRGTQPALEFDGWRVKR